MKCKICAVDFDPRECGSLDSITCKPCMLNQLSTKVCNGTNKTLCDSWNCKKCFDKSFASVKYCINWDYAVNEKWPIDVSRCTETKYSFVCIICQHQFVTTPCNITFKNSSCCPYCSNQKLCNKNDCQLCFDKSFASHPRSGEWSAQNSSRPRDVFKSTAKKFWFKCKICNHEFIIGLDNVVNNRWCTYCANKILCDSATCTACHDKSFAMSKMAKYLLDQDPRSVFYNSGQIGKFKCENGHIFDSVFNNVNGGKWCPLCKHKTETLLHNWLNKEYMNVTYQPKFNWCMKQKYLPFDFQIEKILIELDGRQHFMDIAAWRSTTEDIILNDVYKMQKAFENGFRIIRISQETVYNNKLDWQFALQEAIKNDQKIQYISHDLAMYDKHKAALSI